MGASMQSTKLLLILVLFLIGFVTYATHTRSHAGNFGGWWKPKAKAPEPKYFREHPYYSHYDYRFMVEELDDQHQQEVLRFLMQSYLTTFRNLKVETWLMHGTLLGWWWGQKVMPFDLDADVQVTEADMYYLAAYFNMTTYYFKASGERKGRYYLLEVNPHFEHRDFDDKLNKIDARWIDMASGLYIDITAARYHLTHSAGEGIFYDKNKHEYRDTYVFPLRETKFEGVPAKIPYRYEDMLVSEYGRRAVTQKSFAGYIFDDETMSWILEKKIETEE